MADLQMKLAKPSDKDYEAFDQLRTLLVSYIEFRIATEDLESETPKEFFDDRELIAALGERVQAWWEKHGGSWGRVVFGGQTAIQNACDPNASTLEWKPEIAAAIAKAGTT